MYGWMDVLNIYIIIYDRQTSSGLSWASYSRAYAVVWEIGSTAHYLLYISILSPHIYLVIVDRCVAHENAWRLGGRYLVCYIYHA
jgi:hypothetical protein